MKKTKKLLVIMPIMAAMLFSGVASVSALSGVNADEIDVKVYTKQGDDWFRALYTDTDDDGVLKVKNVLPGKYKAVVRGKDQETGQVIAVKFRMLDANGIKIDEKTDVDVYMYISGVKTLLGTWTTDKYGWLELSALYPDSIYELDVKEEMSLSGKDNKYRVKTKAKIDNSDWFVASYKRTDVDKVLELKNVPSGKYKFKYKAKDASVAMPFTLRLRMLDEDMREVDEVTPVKLSAYIGDVLTPVGTLQTDEDGWITVPGVMTGMKYKVEVD